MSLISNRRGPPKWIIEQDLAGQVLLDPHMGYLQCHPGLFKDLVLLAKQVLAIGNSRSELFLGYTQIETCSL